MYAHICFYGHKVASGTRCRASDRSATQGYTLLGYGGMEEEGNRFFLGWIVREGQVGGGRASKERGKKKIGLMTGVEIRRKEEGLMREN